MRMEKCNTLADNFLRSVELFPDRPALEVPGSKLSYNELFTKAASIAATLAQMDRSDAVPLTAVFAYRSVTAFAGVLAALLRGHGYVPLNRTFPVDRTRTMLQRSGCTALVVDQDSEAQLSSVLEGLEQEVIVILPERQDAAELRQRWPRHRFVSGAELASSNEWKKPQVSPEAIAYLLFTSGSTGIPKGVMVSNQNAQHYIEFIKGRFAIAAEDRFSQTFDMTFDLSVADMFVAWTCGACVCCPSEKTLLNPGRFINDARLTIWFSVPSTAAFMKRLGGLKPGSYPGLRVSMFCGEALPVEVAKAWSEAAPASVIENIYGPTELTIGCTSYRWDALGTPAESEQGVVPIGEPFPGMRPLIVDEMLTEVKPGEAGELLMTGPQLSLGYWRDPVRTAASFVKPPGRAEIYYRTGDRVRRPSGTGPMVYLGRLDNQVKVLGHRVELGEIEAVVREETGVDAVVAIGWPKTAAGAGAVEVFVETEAALDKERIKERISKRLPNYMVPRRYHVFQQLPLNANGKYDRRALTEYLEKLT